MTELFGLPLMPTAEDITALLARLGVNVIFTAIVVRAVYYRLYGQRDYIFTYVLLNIVTFCLAYLLSKVPIELGFALGLFAVFGILRYRTEAIRVRNLTYLFVVIGLALLNALAGRQVTIVELLIVNGVITLTVVVLEALASFSGREECRRVLYGRLELLAPSRTSELLEDLHSRTRLPIRRCEIGDIDLLRDTVDVTVYYEPLRARESATPAHAARERHRSTATAETS